jgi:cobalt-zinc-cadmium efflux system membrane fusion protein
MNGRQPVLIVVLVTAALLAGIALASFMPSVAERFLAIVAFTNGEGPSAPRSPESSQRKAAVEGAGLAPGAISLGDSEIEAAGVALAAAEGGTISHRIVVPGAVVPNADRIAHVAVKLSGTLAELRKKIGDTVTAGEVLAVLESREVADAKSEYLAAKLTNELQQDLYERDKALWDKKISTEQQFLRSRNQAAHAKMRNDIARQKLFALGLSAAEIAGLPDEPETSLRRQEVRAPISGRVVERKVELGVAVGRDNLETELFVIADLDLAWVEFAVGPDDLPLVREGQSVTVSARNIADKAEGKVVFISPMMDKETRSARVMAEIANPDGIWRAGSFVTGAIAFEQKPVPLAVPSAAIQTMGGDQVVFVRTPEGFAKRPIVLGRGDDRAVEVVSGLRPGEIIAVSNTFVLKAELLKALAED